MSESSKSWKGEFIFIIYIVLIVVLDLDRQAKLLEKEIDAKLLSLSKCDASVEDDDFDSTDKSPLLVSVSTDPSTSGGGIFAKLSVEIESLLSRLTEVNEKMTVVAEDIRGTLATHTLKRHKEILADYSKEFRKTKTNVQVNHDRDQLFFSSKKKSNGEIRIQMNNRATDLLNKEMDSTRKYVVVVE